MSKKETNYSIGIDTGSSSVGWAVIDEQFMLLKKTKIIYGEAEYLKKQKQLLIDD